jgi:hypothetical protein
MSLLCLVRSNFNDSHEHLRSRDRSVATSFLLRSLHSSQSYYGINVNWDLQYCDISSAFFCFKFRYLVPRLVSEVPQIDQLNKCMLAGVPQYFANQSFLIGDVPLPAEIQLGDFQ